MERLTSGGIEVIVFGSGWAGLGMNEWQGLSEDEQRG